MPFDTSEQKSTTSIGRSSNYAQQKQIESQEIKKWLHSLLSSSSDTQSNDDNNEDSDDSEVISRFCSHMTRTEKALQSSLNSVSSNTQKLRLKTARWEYAGISALLDQFDNDTLNDLRTIASAYASLQLSAQQALNESDFFLSISDLMNQIDALEFRTLKRQQEVIYTRQKLYDAVKQLAYSKTIQPDIEQRRTEAQEFHQRARVMHTKATQYDDASQSLLTHVRSNTGIKADGTHDAVVKDAKHLAEIERNLKEVNKELEKFCDLPPSFEKCRQLIADMEANIKVAEDDVQNALSSLVSR